MSFCSFGFSQTMSRIRLSLARSHPAERIWSKLWFSRMRFWASWFIANLQLDILIKMSHGKRPVPLPQWTRASHDFTNHHFTGTSHLHPAVLHLTHF